MASMKRVAIGILLVLATLAAAQKTGKTVRVYILAGQSNMEGHGFIAADPKRNDGKGSLEFLAKSPETASRFGKLLDKDGSWRSRNDVFIDYIDRSGPLTVGYGANPQFIGPELGFGWVMGDTYNEPVLLIKCSWGGKSLGVDFRPPSAGTLPYSLGEKNDAASNTRAASSPRYTGTPAASWPARP